MSGLTIEAIAAPLGVAPNIIPWGKGGRFLHWLTLFFSLLLCLPLSAAAQETLCAVVKIEILQELTLERQAFDARLRINNGLDATALQDVSVEIRLSDANGNPVKATADAADATALFFIGAPTLAGVGNISGSGVVAPASSADVHWLLIPARGAGGPTPSGKLYYVGATLRYTLLGQPQVTELTPDYIIVKPLPLLSLDYFLTHDIFADDAFTPVIEPAEPFTLGVRVKNNGQGLARSVKIESAQPRIVENEQGLLINFQITGSAINDQPSIPSLRVNLGDIPPGGATVGRWLMQTTLSGQFVDFTATFSHAAELGGELTSLIGAVNTHLLVHDVRVDEAGRDSIRDFLAKDGDTLRVYESNGVDTEVTDQSAVTTLQPAGQHGATVHYQLTAPVTAGLLYARTPDPYAGKKQIGRVLRSDGKLLALDNAWLSKERGADKKTWRYYLNVFDSNSTGRFTVTLEDRATVPQPPVLQFIPDRTVVEGNPISFLVEASDPNGSLPVVSAAPLPVGARFFWKSQADGLVTYIFDWTPTAGQAGVYPIVFTAADGVFETPQTARITVHSLNDADGDGMDDDWEREHFGNLDGDGAGDFDGDGVSDRDEFLQGTDPTTPPGPGAPTLLAPDNGAAVTVLQPLLRVLNGAHPPERQARYVFEVYREAGLVNLVAGATVPETTETTAWPVDVPLTDNHGYYWRARAYDGFTYSLWIDGRFFVNTVNDPPGPFGLSSPQVDSQVGTLTPTLVVQNSVDLDEEPLRYVFQVFADAGLQIPVTASSALPAGDNGATAWTVNTALQENAWYYWQATVSDPQGASVLSPIGRFRVNTANDPPGLPTLLAPSAGAEVTMLPTDLVVGNAFDPDSPGLRYAFELDRAPTFDSADKRVSGPVTEGVETTAWGVDQLLDNTRYYWRVQADDGSAQSPWAQSSFFVNLLNDPPTAPTVRNPGDGAWVETRQPALELNPATDPDEDRLSYEFEVYDNADLTALLAQGSGATPTWVVEPVLVDNHGYYWRARATDEHGASGPWTPAQRFFVNDDGVDDPPTLTLLQPAMELPVTEPTVSLAWDDADPDSNARISLYYDADATGTDGALIVADLPEDPDGADDRYVWDVSRLPPGRYFVYGLIDDGHGAAASYAPGVIVIAPIAQGAVKITRTSQPDTTEGGVSSTFTVALDRALTADLTLALQSDDPTEGAVSPATVRFTPANWAVPQTVTVTGADDCVQDGNVSYRVVTAPAVSADPQYAGVDAADLTLVNYDNDMGSSSSAIQICGAVEVSRQRVGRTGYDYTYRLVVLNNGPAVNGATLTLRSNAPATTVVEGEVRFGPLAAGERRTADDTYVIRQDARYPFDPAALFWQVAPR